MKVVLKEKVNILGLEWPAGEYEVKDQFWAEALAAVAKKQQEEAESKKETPKPKRKRG